MDKFVKRFASTSSANASTSSAESQFATEEYGYALPLGKGIDVMPMPSFDVPAVHDVRRPFAVDLTRELTHDDAA